MGPQDIPPLVAVVSRYPNLLVELPVKVFQLHSGSSQEMQYNAFDMQPYRELDRGRLQVNEGVRPQARQNGTRYSIEETNQFHEQAPFDERMGTISLPLQIIINRLVHLRHTWRNWGSVPGNLVILQSWQILLFSFGSSSQTVQRPVPRKIQQVTSSVYIQERRFNSNKSISQQNKMDWFVN